MQTPCLPRADDREHRQRVGTTAALTLTIAATLARPMPTRCPRPRRPRVALDGNLAAPTTTDNITYISIAAADGGDGTAGSGGTGAGGFSATGGNSTGGTVRGGNASGGIGTGGNGAVAGNAQGGNGFGGATGGSTGRLASNSGHLSWGRPRCPPTWRSSGGAWGLPSSRATGSPRPPLSSPSTTPSRPARDRSARRSQAWTSALPRTERSSFAART